MLYLSRFEGIFRTKDILEKDHCMEGPDKQQTKSGEFEELKRLLSEADEKIAYQRKSFSALLLISQSLGESPSIDDVFTQAIQPIQEITGFNTIALRLYVKSQRQFVLRAHKGFSLVMLEILSNIPRPIDEIYFSQMMETKKAVIRDVYKVIGNDRFPGLTFKGWDVI